MICWPTRTAAAEHCAGGERERKKKRVAGLPTVGTRSTGGRATRGKTISARDTTTTPRHGRLVFQTSPSRGHTSASTSRQRSSVTVIVVFVCVFAVMPAPPTGPSDGEKCVRDDRRRAYAEFSEFGSTHIKQIENIFDRYDRNKDGYLCRNELKRMMIERRVPWTESSLSRLIDDADADKDGRLTFREFVLTNRKTLEHLQRCLAKREKVDFNKVGIKGVRDFFEAKAKYSK